MSKVWFITGTSKGFGRIWAEAALERGDRVVATARNADTLTPLAERYGDLVLPLALDVTDKAAIDAAVKRAHEHFGRLDVVVNNAGYGLFGTIEEVTEEQARDQIETNLFGAAVGDQGGAADPARAGLGPHHPGLDDRRRERVPGDRAVPRVQVGPRGLQPGAGGRGRRASASRSRSSSRPASRPTGAARPRSSRTRCPSTRRSATTARRAAPTATSCGSRATRRPPARRSSSSSTPRSRRCGLLRHRHAGHDQRGVREADRELGDVGPPRGRGAGRSQGMRRSASRPPRWRSSRASTSPASARSSPAARPGSASRPPRALAKAGADVTLAVRDVDAGERVATEIGATDVRYLELAKLDSVEAFVARLGRSAAHPGQQRGRDGDPRADAQRGRPGDAVRDQPRRALRARPRAARRDGAEGARIVSVSSTGHLRSPVVFDDLNFAFRDYEGFLAYGQSKTANVLFAVGATARWARDGIYANALMPGGIATALQRHQPPEYIEQAQQGACASRRPSRARRRRCCWRPIPRSRASAAATTRTARRRPSSSAAASAARGGVAPYALDADNADRLWELSERLLGAHVR